MTMRALVAASALLLAGCASGVPVERQTVVPGAGFQAVQGEASLVVRTFLPPVEGARQEVLGARCAVVSSLYRAELVTPSRLLVPNFGPQSPEITFDCRAGALAGSGTVRIATYWRDAPGFGGYGFYRPWGPWGWYGGAGYPVSQYPDVAIELR